MVGLRRRAPGSEVSADMPSIVEQIVERNANDFSIPIIDFSKFLHGSTADKSACGREIIEGFTSSGFIYLSNYGISASELADVYRHSAEFFKLGVKSKEALPWQGAASNRGYSAMGREKVSEFMDADSIGQERQSLPDLKESFEIGREPCDDFQNKWPAELPAFPAKMMSFFDSCHQVHRQVMRAIAIGLKLDEHWFDSFTQIGDNTLRLLHYPSIHPAIFDKIGQVRAGSHSDYGSITLLFQDESGGLQVQRPDGSFVDAKPIPGTIVVNAGDLLSRWSNDLIKSTHHRVIQPPVPPAADGKYPARYSIAYFCNPDFDKMIECIDHCWSTDKPCKYEPVKSGDWLEYRFAASRIWWPFDKPPPLHRTAAIEGGRRMAISPIFQRGKYWK